ncbi:PAS domain S-box protein [Terrarubrum flagellatum]|uniref:hybrid sensor histidine kinase/response regulator n=1 Tax=Terrirubrum flagellatum TaxID=2895980 RepID=UPI003145010F
MSRSPDGGETALRTGGVATFEFEFGGGSAVWSGDASALFDGAEPPYDVGALLALLGAEEREALAKTLGGVARGERSFGFIHCAPRPGHAARWTLFRGKAIEGADGHVARLVGAAIDVTEQRKELAQARSHLEDRSRRLETMVDSAVSAILTIDNAGRIQAANKATISLFGYSLEEMIGRNVRMLMPERYAVDHDQYIKNYVDTGRKKIIGIGREVTGQRKDASTFAMHLAVSEFEDNGRRYFTGIITDLTARDAAEKAIRDSQLRLAEAQKMDAIGQLTGGVAHDFNNLLTVISGNLELLDMRLDDERARDLVRRADEAARMGARLTERLLTFSRRRKLQPSVLDLNEVALGMLELLRRSLGETVRVDANLAPDLWNVKVDPSEIENAILNLCINGRDAMPDGGRILIETNNVRLDDVDIADFGGLPVGDYVKLAVSDTGSGMSPEVVARAFEPFFTTKETGRGTGLGLSTIYGFVKQSGGDARIYSEVGKGTTANLYLPRATGEIEARAPSANIAESTPPEAERILVVEDNPQVRELTIRRLEILGYETLVAENGPDAISLLEAAKVDLVFSDVVMPAGMSGFDVAGWVHKNRPEIRVLLTSGFAPEIASAGAETAFAGALLRKPYTQTDLARAVRKALRER